MRVAAGEFELSNSQRRCLRRNQDIQLTISDELDHPAALELYARYQTDWHQAATIPETADIKNFLAESVVDTVLTLYHHEQELLGAGWVDRLENGLSSVYFAFEPSQARRSLGVFSLLTEIDLVRRLGKKWLYLGFMVPGCAAMEYKKNYGPHELLIDGRWQPDPDQAEIDALVAANQGQSSTS